MRLQWDDDSPDEYKVHAHEVAVCKQDWSCREFYEQ